MSISTDLSAESRNLSAAMPRRAKRRVRATRVKPQRGFAVMASATLFVGAVVLIGTILAHLSGTNDRTPARITKITRPLPDGVLCRHIAFDNVTGRSITDKVEPCVAPPVARRAPGKPVFKWNGN